MFFSISSLWNAVSSFARNLGVSGSIIAKAKQDFNKLLNKYHRTRGVVMEKHKSQWDASLSIQRFFPWWANLLCFFELELSGFRHAALRELRSYLEASERSYYIDSRYPEKSYEDKVKILRLFKSEKNGKKIKFKELLRGIPTIERNDIGKFYSDLCEYVHLSEQAQTDALSDFSLNLALNHPYYEDDVEMLEKTFDYTCYLLIESLK